MQDSVGHPLDTNPTGGEFVKLSIGGRTYYTFNNVYDWEVSSYEDAGVWQNEDTEFPPAYTGLWDASSFTPTPDPIPCFTSGTLIETNQGNKPVEELQPGDMIATLDDGYQPIRWIGSTRRDAVDLAHNPKLRPIRIPAGALGNGLPKRDLMVSRQHRVLVRSKIAQRMFGAEEILIPASKLVGMNGSEIAGDVEDVTYFHILFDKHQVIFSEDAPTESLFTGPVALQSVPPEARKEIETLFPQITEPDFMAESARLIPAKGSEVKKLVARHLKHAKPML
ncbi:hemolysin [Paracoccus methylarcula]|uniref:Hemolysin n=2 Tax=Paracoccus methylarcula TaxID=72022 RepID=A0A3R7P3H4_9RHOB|nr:hemolysin [Paracoccus methylarcula]